MANIGTSIELYDRLSAPINNMIGAIDNMIGAYQSLDRAMDNGLDPTQINEARGMLASATAQVDQMGDYIRQNEQAQNRFNNEVSEGASAADGLANKVMGLVGAYAGLQGLQKLVNVSDTFTQTRARLGMIVDEQSNVEELQNKIFASAQRARAPYQEMADTVAKLSLNAKDAFSSNNETIQFAENLNKLFAIAGTEQASIAAASLQLTQALGSGVLRGEEFNAVFEAAPNIMQTVADSMGVPIGSLRGMAAEGKITADIVKNALLGATEDINSQFESMPMTWSQVWTGVMNRLYMASKPLLEAISWLAQNWSIIEPIVLCVAGALLVYLAATKGVELATKAWTAAQAFFNGVMALNPVFLIIMGIILLISLIYAVVAAINKVTGKTISATGVIAGSIMAAVAFVWNLFLGLLDLVLAVINWIWNGWAAFANFFGNIFNDPIASIIHLFGDMADRVLGILESIASAIDKVFGSNLAGAVQGWRSGLDSWIEGAAEKYGNGSYEKIMDEVNLTSESLGLSRWAYGDAYNTGYNWGADVGDSVSNALDGGVLAENMATTAQNTGKVADAIDIPNEDLKYLRDIAERDAVNKFTTAEIKVEMTNNNSINKNMDLDGVVDYLVTGVNEAMEKAAEGVHV